MLHRRICYGAALLAALQFQLFYTGYLSTYVLVLAVLLPLLSLALSLPGMLGCALALEPEEPTVPRGGEGVFLVKLTNPTRLPLTRVKLRLSCVNGLTGERRTARRQFRGASRGAEGREVFPAPHCGRLLCRVEGAWVCDLLGLFSLPVRRPAPAALLAIPLPVELDGPPEPAGNRGQGAGLRPRPGGGPGEDYDLRPYRAGDPLRAVHWKLSSKLDELVVRETLEERSAPLALTFDLFGGPEALDWVLDRLYTLSLRLLERGRAHSIYWAHPATGALCGGPVERERDLIARLGEACAEAAPREGNSILDRSIRVPGAEGPVRRLHVARPDGEGGAP